MRSYRLAVRSNEWKSHVMSIVKEISCVVGFDSVYPYVVTYLLSDMVLGYISLFELLCVFTDVDEILVVNRRDRFILS